MNNSIKEVLLEIKPSKEEEKEVNKRINDFIKRVNNTLNSSEYKAVLGGSGAKGTWLKDSHDADIFVQFNYKKYKDKSNKLSDILEKKLEKKFKNIQRLHGSRDYFQIIENDFTFEIVPILKINKSEDAMNITDVSMLHSKWVNNKIKKNPKLSDDIRLTKKLCKANKIYGAESYINGFSGYICEILTIYYKSFRRLIREISKWEKKVIIDPEKYYRTKHEVLFNLNNSKLTSPLVVVDPVQKDRNAAAALADDKFEIFIDLSKNFIKSPSKKFFERKEITPKSLKKKYNKDELLILDIISKKGKEDVIGCKLLKAFDFITKKIEKNEFFIKDKGWQFDKENNSLMWWVIKKDKRSKTKIVQGPPTEMKDHVKTFKKKYKNNFDKKGILYAEVKREYMNSKNLIKHLVKEKYFKEKVKNVKIVL